MITKWTVIFFLSMGAICSTMAQAEEKYPTKPVNFIFVYSPGGGADASTKAFLEAYKKELSANFVPKYVLGAGGSVGAYELSKAKPDGYTLGMTTLVAMAFMPHTQGVKFDPLKDFDFIGTFMQFNVGWMVRADSPYKTLKDLIEAARQKPGEIKFANATPGGFLGLGVQYLENKENIQFKNIPFPKGTGDANAALLGGHVDFTANNPPGIIPYLKSGQARMLVSTSPMRHCDPNAPTLKELGYDFAQVSANAIGAPKGLPGPIRKKLIDGMAKAVKDPEFIKLMNNMDVPIEYNSGDEYKEIVLKSHKAWGEILKGYRY